jgi:ParB family chromosome partitioning protein
MALGRGLGELLGEIETAYETNNEKGTQVKDTTLLDIDLIEPNPYQPRKIFNEEKLQELSDSIKQHGLLQPVVVIKDEDKYILVAGERRLKASKLASFDKIKAIILEEDKKKLRELALIENIQRDDLNIIEVAYSYAGLINDFKMTHDELSKIVSKSRSSITNILRVLTLSNDTQKLIASNKLSLGHAKVIVGLDSKLEKIVVDSIIGQKLSVRDTENLIKKLKNGEEKPDNIKKTNQNNNLNYDLLQNVTQSLKKNELDAKVDKNYFKIKIDSQNDIEKIAKYFNIC